jgi:starch synthase
MRKCLRKESRWPQQIRFVPFIQDNAEYEPLFIAGSQLVVLPSLEEPCGQLAMKAMRLGTPPLVNPVGGLAEIVNDGYNGFVVPSGGDSMESRVSEMMVRLNSRIREKDENWRRMQQRAMEAVSDWDRPAEHYTAHYRSLIKQKSLNHKNKTCCPF